MKALFDVLQPGETDWLLAESIDPARIPAHIAIIMDGNGRWARRRSLPRIAGHRAGVEPVRSTVEACARMGVQALTLYAFSVENWKRPRAEIEALWRLLRIYIRRELPEMMENDIRFDAIGRLDALPAFVQREIEMARNTTHRNNGLRVNLAVNYGGRTEITDAVNTLIEEARHNGSLATLNITEETLHARLYTAGLPDPDLLIRTSGEMRISNFLLWQIAYSELYVTDKLWPDFRRTDLLKAVIDYQRRDRRFGGLGANGAPEPMPEYLGAASR
jgi:undecaprenyl diphosphate synthase